MSLRDAPIQRKLMRIILLTSSAVLLLTCASFFTCEYFLFRETTIRNLSTLGEIISNNSTAALAFANQADAKEVLAALKANPHIVAASLYDEEGKIFSQYPENLSPEAFPRAPEGDGYRLEQGHLISFQPVVQGTRRLGTLYLKSDMKAMYDRFRVFGYIAAVVIAASFLVAYMISTGLQRQISQPILALAKTARAVADHQDYSVRAPQLGEGEFRLLTDAFNHMLTEIHDGTRALTESEERFRSAMQYSAIGMALVAPDGRWLDVNQALCRIVGYTTGEMLTRDFRAITHPDDLDEELHHFRRILAREIETYRLEERYVHKEGHLVWVNVSVSLVCAENGMPLYLISQIQDITERKRDEELLRNLNSELEQRVEERTCALNAANKELEGFSYSVSHDLRAPLRAIDGFSRILIEDHSDHLDEAGLRVLEVIRGNTSKMASLIDDMLAFSRLGRKQIERSLIDFDALVRESSEELNSASGDGKVQFKILPLPDARGDCSLIRQVVANLLSNAAKYSSTREEPAIEVGGYIENGENVYYVKDNGVGFDMAYANKLFGVFQRLHGADEFEGTGVGLAIVQRIVQRHGGRVWADAKVNEGATFYFTLPKEFDSN